ncbi:RNA polymerase sigma factor [Enterococcus diestrammenae]|uniref:RNA polymerase sigma factor n=1 Tax=Enterococcus diestrammenae TaxID=1155073 RepID=UPI0019594150
MKSNIFLVKRAKKGDPDAFVTLFQAYEPVLHNTARKMLRNEQDIADVMQETALTAFQNIHQLKQDKMFNTWVYRILINNCTKYFHSPTHYELFDNDSAVDSPTENRIIMKELLNKLDEKYKVPIVLFYYTGFSVKEISNILSLPEGTIKSNLSRGRALLQKDYLHYKKGVLNFERI